MCKFQDLPDLFRLNISRFVQIKTCPGFSPMSWQITQRHRDIISRSIKDWYAIGFVFVRFVLGVIQLCIPVLHMRDYWCATSSGPTNTSMLAMFHWTDAKIVHCDTGATKNCPGWIYQDTNWWNFGGTTTPCSSAFSSLPAYKIVIFGLELRLLPVIPKVSSHCLAQKMPKGIIIVWPTRSLSHQFSQTLNMQKGIGHVKTTSSSSRCVKWLANHMTQVLKRGSLSVTIDIKISSSTSLIWRRRIAR